MTSANNPYVNISAYKFITFNDTAEKRPEFIAKCQEIGQSRELSLAITNAEQAVMWAVKHVTR
mgnify:CR=1 FL=1